MEYFIEKDNEILGPYDLMSMIRKVRNKVLEAEDKVIVGAGAEPKAAFDVIELRDIFEEENNFIDNTQLQNKEIDNFNLRELIEKGADFFRTHANLTLITGVFLLIVMFGNYLLYSLMNNIVFVIFSSVWNSFVFCLLQIIILRKTRMQLASAYYIVKTVKRYGMNLLIYSVVIGNAILFIPFVLSTLTGSLYPLLLVLLPGSLLMMVFFYAPIIIVDQGVGVIDSLGKSISFLKKIGLDNFVILYTLLLANFIAMTLFVLPVLVTVPITFGVLSEIYDEYYN